MQADCKVNICVVGPISVGKTSLVKHYESVVRTTSADMVQPSLMAELTRLKVKVGQRQVDLTITDTPGMQRLFDAIPRNLLRNQQAYVLVFDLSDRETFDDLHNWLSSIREICHKHSTIFIVGNKSDRVDGRKV